MSHSYIYSHDIMLPVQDCAIQCPIYAIILYMIDTRALNVKLGYAPSTKLLIVNADDAGMCHAANAAVKRCIEQGRVTSTTLMAPCPWFSEMADYARRSTQASFGVHLTHTSEWGSYRWGPVGIGDEFKSLVDPKGYLFSDVVSFMANATPKAALAEAKAQVARALSNGIDISHVDSHMGALCYSLPLWQAHMQVAKDLNVPIRMPSQSLLDKFGMSDIRKLAAEMGLVFPDYLIHGDRANGEDIEVYWRRILNHLQPGVTELYIHPSVPTDEVQAITGSWRDRSTEFRLFSTDPEIGNILRRNNIKLISYLPLRTLQRSL